MLVMLSDDKSQFLVQAFGFQPREDESNKYAIVIMNGYIGNITNYIEEIPKNGKQQQAYASPKKQFLGNWIIMQVSTQSCYLIWEFLRLFLQSVDGWVISCIHLFASRTMLGLMKRNNPRIHGISIIFPILFQYNLLRLMLHHKGPVIGQPVGE